MVIDSVKDCDLAKKFIQCLSPHYTLLPLIFPAAVVRAKIHIVYLFSYPLLFWGFSRDFFLRL